MKKFTCVQDIGDLKSALAEAFEIKKERFKYVEPVSYTHLRAHETGRNLVCRLLLEKKKKKKHKNQDSWSD